MHVPNDHPTEFGEPNSGFLGFSLRKIFHKYEHPTNNNEFGLWRSPITLQEYESARDETMDYFLQLNQPLICSQYHSSLKQIIQSTREELEAVQSRVKQSGAELVIELNHKLDRLQMLNEMTNCATVGKLDEQAKQSAINLHLSPDKSTESVTDSLGVEYTKYSLGMQLPQNFAELKPNVDTEFVKYYNCLHHAFYKVLILHSVTDCRRDLAEFRICHTRLLKLPNIKERRWKSYLNCVNAKHLFFHRKYTNQLHFYEKPGWWKRIIRMGKEIDV